MSVTIKFDNAGMPELPTCILSKRSGEHIGVLTNITNVHFTDNFNSSSEFSFVIYKNANGKLCNYWKDIRDERIIYIPEWSKWFEIHVEITEDNDCTKTVTAISLCEEELSKIYLYDIEINTTDDIERSDYVKTVIYNKNNANGSLLNRILKDKAQHYKILHVDTSIAKLQRTFSFDNISIYDAFQEIAEEIHCLFVFGAWDENHESFRTISVYDLESVCNDCEHRDEFLNNTCTKCGSNNITQGYGEDTTIFVSTENLSDDINYSENKESVKNCFRLKSGDEDMDAAIANCNPSGSLYLQYITDRTKEDMSEELVNKLNTYDEENDYYTNRYNCIITNTLLNNYNQLVEKYKIYDKNLKTITSPIVGYKNLMNIYYDTIDFSGYLKNSLMPPMQISETTAKSQAALLTQSNLSPVSVENINYISLATANSTVLAYAKVYIDTSKYKITVNSSSISGTVWTGNFKIESYSDEEDTAISKTINVTFNNNYENFTRQKIDKILSKDNYDLSIVGLFKNDINTFKIELKKYSLSYLQIFHESCQSCLDILIEQGISDKSSQTDLYNSLYKPYFNKLNIISEEILLREKEINIITGKYDLNGRLITNGIQSIINKCRKDILNKLDFQKYLGDYWNEFCSFRNEDLWKNDNYISDGLNNAQLFQRAEEFLEAAKKELIKSATMQHSISSSLKNLLVMDCFKPITKFFSVGNWIRLLVDEKIYKLRIINYEIDYEDLSKLSVTFSDVVEQLGTISDLKDILNQSKSISSSYSSIKHQAEKMEVSDNYVKDWLEKGFNATTTKIVNNAENQSVVYDEHGMLFRELDPLTNSYLPTQLKIINSTLAVTTNAWETSSVGVGKFIYFDPEDKQYKTGYGVIADTIVGNIILGKSVGIYNEAGTLTFNTNGLEVKNGNNSFKVNPNADKMLSLNYNGSELFSVSKNSAKLCGFNINNRAIYNGTESINSKNKGIYIGQDGINITTGENSFKVNPNADILLSIANKTENIFYIDKNGKLHIKGDGSGLDISTNSSITMKVNKNNIISSINQSAESVSINATKINLNGIVTANQNFKILSDGSMEAKNGTFSGNLNFDSASISSNGVFKSWGRTQEGADIAMQIDRARLTILNNNYNRFILENWQYGVVMSVYDDNPNLVFFCVSAPDRKVTINGSLTVSGAKSRVAETDNYSNRLLYCYEMSTPMFGDIGEAKTDMDGECLIYLDDIFSETVNTNIEYQVFLQKEGEGDIWIAEKAVSYFIVKGTPNLKFAWEIKVKQKNFEYDRLEISKEF